MAAEKRSTSSNRRSGAKQSGGNSSSSGTSSDGSSSGPVVTLPLLHRRVGLPRPEDLAYYGTIGLLAALELVEWPVAAIIAGGHVLANHSHDQVGQRAGQGAENA